MTPAPRHYVSSERHYSAGRPASPAILLRYHLNPGESLRYKLTADIHGSVPILDSPTPTDLNAAVRIVYVATPRTRLADGTMDVEFKVESAEIEIEKIPFPIPEEQAQQILNQTVSLIPTGEVKRVKAGAPLPFGVSIPGVDPKRLYALLFPIVFQSTPVKTGDKWNFKSELLGGQGAAPVFTATLLATLSGELAVTSEKSSGKTSEKSREKSRENSREKSSGKARSSPVAVNSGSSAPMTRLREDFQMGVDQKLDKDKKPVTEGKPVHYTRQGKIEGSGIFEFDQARGRISSGTVTIRADVNEDLVGKPEKEDEPKRMTSKVEAKVRILLEPASKVGEVQTKQQK